MFRQKDPKPLAPGRGPPGAFAPVPKVRAAELASLKQSSPPTRFRDCGAAAPAGALRWRHGMARFFPSPSGPLLCSGRISCGLPSHGAFRFLAASSGGMRCRPYNCTTTLDSCFRRNDRKRNDCGAAAPAGALRWRQKLARFFPSPSGPLLCSGRISCGLPSHGAFRCLAASSGGMRCRPYNCTTTLDSCFRRNDRKRNDRGAAAPAGALEMAPWDGGGTKTKTVDCSKIQRDIFRLPCYCVRSGTQINEVYDG